MKVGAQTAANLAFLGSILLCGCASYEPLFTTRPQPGRQQASRTTTPPLRSADPWTNRSSYQSTPPPPETTAATTAPDRYNSLINLYGELKSSGPGGVRPMDGSSNLSQVTIVTEGACFDPDVDRTGKWLVFASTMHRPTPDIYLKATDGNTVTRLTSDPADDVMPAYSPDGQRIAFASTRSGNWDIYIMSMDGSRPVQITNDHDHELHPTWSPDGRRLAYCRLGAQSGRWELWVVDLNNPGIPHFLDYGMFPQWCPDVARTKILFQRARQRGSRFFSVWTIDYTNGEAMYPTEIVSAGNAAIINPAWSPDGGRIVFSTVVDPSPDPESIPTHADLWIVNLDGSGRTSLTNGRFANFQPTWGVDGKVYFVSNRSGIDNIWAVDTGRLMRTQPRTSDGVATVETPAARFGRQP